MFDKLPPLFLLLCYENRSEMSVMQIESHNVRFECKERKVSCQVKGNKVKCLKYFMKYKKEIIKLKEKETAQI